MREYDLLGDAFFDDPYPTFAALRRHDPCWYDPQLEAHIVTRFDDVERILQDPRFSSQRVRQFVRGAPAALQPKVDAYVQQLERWLLFMDPPHHAVLRTRLLQCFGPRFIPIISEAAADAVGLALASVEREPSPNVIEHYAYPIPAVVLATVLGISRDDIERFKRWTTDIFALMGSGIADEQAVELGYRGVTELRAYVLALIAQKRVDPQDDVLSALAAADDGSEAVSDEDIVGMFMTLIIAGYESSMNLIASALHNILADPRCRTWIARRGGLSDSTVDEFMRHDGSVFTVLRRATQDTVVADSVVRKGGIVITMLNAANRDPRKFVDPDRLDLDRPTSAHLALGIGMHGCVGGAMARIVVREAVGRFVLRFPDAVAVDGCSWQRNLSFRGLRSLPVTLGRVADA